MAGMQIGSILITGANRGLGLEFVKQLVNLTKPPKIIFATCRDKSKAEELTKIADSNSIVKILELDVKDSGKFPTIRKELEKDLGDCGLNLLINNAGVLHNSTIETVTKEAMMDSYEVNVVSPLLLTKELLPLLKIGASKSSDNKVSAVRAGVVNITSKMGSIADNGSGSGYAYRASKTALNMVTKSLSLDLKEFQILAFALHPGWVQTDMGGKHGLLDTKTSVEAMLNTIMNSSAESAGAFLNYDGKIIPW